MKDRTSELTIERLRELLDYYPQTGVFVWRVGRCARKVAGCKGNRGYILIRIGEGVGRQYMASRLAWFYMSGNWPSAGIDHKDRNRANDSIFNLRPATRGQNGANSDRRRDNTSGYRGVYWYHRKRKWRTQITVNGRTIYLGLFHNIEDAAAAYAAAAHHHWGEYGRP